MPFYRTLFITLVASFFLMPVSFAQKAFNDGFGPAMQIEGKHFTVHLKPDVDALSVLHKLDYSTSNRALVGGEIVQNGSLQEELVQTLDSIFLHANEILDMHVYSYKGHIKIFRTQKELSDMFRRLYRRKLPDTGVSYYSTDLNTIYISEEGFKLGVLGHEMGHAIISAYFVVMPPEKIQEVLAGYVDFQLRKMKKKGKL